MERKKSTNRGARNARARLLESDVVRIRENAAAGMSAVEQARFYEVSAETIRRIVRGETWGHTQTFEAPLPEGEQQNALAEMAERLRTGAETEAAAKQAPEDPLAKLSPELREKAEVLLGKR